MIKKKVTTKKPHRTLSFSKELDENLRSLSKFNLKDSLSQTIEYYVTTNPKYRQDIATIKILQKEIQLNRGDTNEEKARTEERFKFGEGATGLKSN